MLYIDKIEEFNNACDEIDEAIEETIAKKITLTKESKMIIIILAVIGVKMA